METVKRRDGFSGLSRLHPVIVHELGFPDSCLYLPPVTDACCQSVWDGPRSASPSRSSWISYEPQKPPMNVKRLINSLLLFPRGTLYEAETS